MNDRFGSAAPILRVESVRTSLDYYTNVLGFSLDWDAGGMVSVSRDDCTVFLTEWAQGQRGTWVWIGVSDCDALHDELRDRGARIRHAPTNFDWAYEMQIEDLDGNVLRLGSSSRKHEPYGKFLDANGKRWDTNHDSGSRA